MDPKSPLERKLIAPPESIKIGQTPEEFMPFLNERLRVCRSLVEDYSKRPHNEDYVLEKEYEIRILEELRQTRSVFREAIARKIGNVSLKLLEKAFVRVSGDVENFNKEMEK